MTGATQPWFCGELGPRLAALREVRVPGDWFRAFEVADGVFVLHEPRHYEGVNAYLLVRADGAVLIDTGCGVGDLRAVVETITLAPVTVVNTHTHLDHVCANARFDAIMMLDHPFSRRLAREGAANDAVARDLLAPGLVAGPWPAGFDPGLACLEPFAVERWLRDGERVAVAGLELDVIATPGEAADHICLLDRHSRVLFSGDILLHGAVWSHLEHGSVRDLAASYRKLLGVADAFDTILPSHNEPCLERDLLDEALAGTERVLDGTAPFTDETDPWGRRHRRYAFDRISILEAAG